MLVEITDRSYWLERVNRNIDYILRERKRKTSEFEYEWRQPQKFLWWTYYNKWDINGKPIFDKCSDLHYFRPIFDECSDLHYFRYSDCKNWALKHMSTLENMRRVLNTINTGTIYFTEKEIDCCDLFP